MRGGELVSKPLRFTGRRLSLNFSTSAAGDIRVEIQAADGTPLPGYTLDECPPIFGDTVARDVIWNAGGSVASLAGQTVRLRFVLRDADLFSFQFQE